MKKRVSARPIMVEANGMDDYDDKMTMSVKLKRNRHTTAKEIKHEEKKKKCCN